jgi:hypothetical protein
MKLNRNTCGDGRPRPSSRVKPGSALAALRQTLALFRAALREIFDESAYERFLAQHQLTSSAAAYSSFCQERDHSRARRPRCC